MIHVDPFTAALRDAGIERYTGVPCSHLEGFVSHASASGKIEYLPVANEGDGVALAAGSYLAGDLAAVVLQNSGLGNCVNPLTSLAIPYRIPMLLLVSHRGEGGRDAPQHRVMGAVTRELLQMLGIETLTLPVDLDGAVETMQRAIEAACSRELPVAVVVPKDTFEPYPFKGAPARKRAAPTLPALDAPPRRGLDSRLEALRKVATALDETDVAVATTGMTSRELFAEADRDANFYMMGSMGCAPALALGIARSRPDRRVVVIDGDGAFLMRMGIAATIGSLAPQGLLHVVLDNGCYETTGGQPTASPTTAFEHVALAAGYSRAERTRDAKALGEYVARFKVGQGPALVTLAISGGHEPGVGRVGPSPQEIRDRMRLALASPREEVGRASS